MNVTKTARLSLLGLAGTALMASACSSDGFLSRTSQNYRAWEERYNPVHVPSRVSTVADQGTQWSQTTFTARFKAKSARLTSQSQRELSNLSSRYRGRGVRVTVLLDLAKGKMEQKLLAKRRTAITRELAAAGLTPSRVEAVPGSRNKDAAVVLIGVQTTAASRCPEWNRSLTGKPVSVEQWRFGCTTRSSLRAHINNPNDLKRGRPLGDYDGAAAAKSIEEHREGKLDKLPETEGTSGGGS